MRRLRIGLLGAARIAPQGIVEPAKAEARAELIAVAARDPARAARFAATYGIGRVHAGYPELLADGDVDLVYVATPPFNHAELAILALEAGKHVLVEKPFAMTAAEATRVSDAARDCGRRAFEAMHSVHHPLFRRVAELVAAGEIGRVRKVRAGFDITLDRPRDFRWRARFGGGALMDLGVYPLAFVRRLLGEDFAVEHAAAVLRGDVDQSFEARLRFADGAVAEVSASFAAPLAAGLSIAGDRGTIFAENPVVPHRGHRLRVASGGTEREEHLAGPSSWTAQLGALCDTLLDGAPFALPEDDFVHSMEAIERIRRAGGWPQP